MSSSKRPVLRWALFALIPLILLFAALELGLWAAGFEGTSMAELVATAGFHEGAYVHRRDRILGRWYLPAADRAGWRVSNPKRVGLGFHRESFPEEPGAARRFFTLGGSTTLGMPFEFEGRGFASRLEERARGADKSFRVINAGVAGMDSVAFPSLAEELLTYHPEALLIYAGNNEIKGQLIEECTNPYRLGVERALNELGTVRLLRTLYVRLRGQARLKALRSPAQGQQDCMVDQLNASLNERVEGDGPPKRSADGAWPRRADAIYERTLRSFEADLTEVVGDAAKGDVAVWLAIPPINLKDTPNRTMVSPGLGGDALSQLKALHRQLEEAVSRDETEAILTLTEAILSLDPGEAIVHHRRGMTLASAGRPDEARPHLQMAAEWDYMGDRVTPSLQDVVRGVCAAHGNARCVDVEAVFNDAAADGLPGADLFVDYCHPTFDLGTDLIAEAFWASLAASSLGE